jgi:hypothetical protein
MAASEAFEAPAGLAAAALRAYELGRLRSALVRGTAAAALAAPGLLLCGQRGWAGACVAAFGLVVAAGRMRGGAWEAGSRSGAIAGIVPCLLPAAVRLYDPALCMFLMNRGPWICAAGGAVAGVVLGLRGIAVRGLPFWGSALAALAFAGAIGCFPAGALGFAGLALGVVAGGAPVLVTRREVWGSS